MKAKILIVSGDRRTSSLLQVCLERAEVFDVVVTGPSGAMLHRPHAVVIDLDSLGGEVLLDEFRSLQVPAICVSGQREARVTEMRSGETIPPQPFSPVALASTLREMLQDRGSTALFCFQSAWTPTPSQASSS